MNQYLLQYGSYSDEPQFTQIDASTPEEAAAEKLADENPDYLDVYVLVLEDYKEKS
jgi:hypothetical protein